MKRLLLPTLILSALTLGLSADDAEQARIYELRTYFANEGKLDALHARFRDHTCKLFEKHGIDNVGYWVPVDNPDHRLVYLVSYPSREAREKSWKAFFADGAWKAAYQRSIEGGKLVSKVESEFLVTTDYSPKLEVKAADAPRLFELRRYTTDEGKLAALDSRFRDHTCGLFEKHGMTNVIYLHLMDDQEAATTTLVYLIAHKDETARDASFEGFRKDPAWQSARKASEEAGPILVKKGVKATLLNPVDYSPLK